MKLKIQKLNYEKEEAEYKIQENKRFMARMKKMNLINLVVNRMMEEYQILEGSYIFNTVCLIKRNTDTSNIINWIGHSELENFIQDRIGVCDYKAEIIGEFLRVICTSDEQHTALLNSIYPF